MNKPKYAPGELEEKVDKDYMNAVQDKRYEILNVGIRKGRLDIIIGPLVAGQPMAREVFLHIVQNIFPPDYDGYPVDVRYSQNRNSALR